MNQFATQSSTPSVSPYNGLIAGALLQPCKEDVGKDPFGLMALRATKEGNRLYSLFEFSEIAMGHGGKIKKNDVKSFIYSVLAAEVVANYFRFSPEEIFSKSRAGQEIAGARFISMAIASVCGGFQSVQLARVYGRDRTTVRHGVERIEFSRMDDHHFDTCVEMLEGSVLDLWALVGDARGFDEHMARLM